MGGQTRFVYGVFDVPPQRLYPLCIVWRKIGEEQIQRISLLKRLDLLPRTVIIPLGVSLQSIGLNMQEAWPESRRI